MNRFRQHRLTDFYFPIVAFHEQVMGANVYISRAKKIDNVLHGYRLLEEILVQFKAAQVLSFDRPSAQQFDALRGQRIRIGNLRIASIALSHNMTVLTRNLVDYQQVPNLRVEDWTV